MFRATARWAEEGEEEGRGMVSVIRRGKLRRTHQCWFLFRPLCMPHETPTKLAYYFASTKREPFSLTWQPYKQEPPYTNRLYEYVGHCLGQIEGDGQLSLSNCKRNTWRQRMKPKREWYGPHNIREKWVPVNRYFKWRGLEWADQWVGCRDTFSSARMVRSGKTVAECSHVTAQGADTCIAPTCPGAF
ncbi:hypothetical protein BDN70DRAFT_899194 [Pholiota conissans]|uniref:Uncharacterized protein n=1 Tax=Pholiota conissans TaxID=109636 RepID=A0A9P6CPP6_9AGAR|nr:hypothetical protein BDN70DRAFT_899194 [Pholiota conissans]